uniref:F-box/LRR-repeat protein At5g02910-like n=1 Tax=Nicotiana sylvestris TaxID=4096 RepID=A0A1U7UWY8_NICSY|nr:PREDICTED: F-box/LRR-repeat protein At5g02910-like [Nicotiana sylvestris]
MASNDPTTVDRISVLPDSLLHHILSLMPIEEAFITHAFSKGWRYLWTSLYNFYFNCELYNEEYVSFVDYVLAHSVSPKIKEFVLHFHDPNEYKSALSRWLSFAVEKKVENVVLWSYSEDDACPLPEFFYTCSSLITLILGFCYFDAGVVISWKSLKSIPFKCMAIL